MEPFSRLGHSQKGFSLIEIVLAIGIIAFAIVAIMGMFPVALRSAQESQRETRAALIAQDIYSNIGSINGTNRTIPLGTNAYVSINLATTNSVSINYDQDGTILGSGTAGGAIFRADISVSPDSPIAGLSRVQTIVSSPATAPTNSYSRSAFTFITLFNRN